MEPSKNLTERPSADCRGYNCPIGALKDTLAALQLTFPMLMDLTAVDHGVNASPRFEMVYHLFNPTTHEYVRVASFCAPSPEPTAPSVTDLWPAANWHERECYDFFGIVFEGHPDLRRILMWEGYPYHPLRKDFPLAGIPVPLPDEEVAELMAASVRPAPMVGGPFVAAQSASMRTREPRGKDESWSERKEKR